MSHPEGFQTASDPAAELFQSPSLTTPASSDSRQKAGLKYGSGSTRHRNKLQARGSLGTSIAKSHSKNLAVVKEMGLTSPSDSGASRSTGFLTTAKAAAKGRKEVDKTGLAFELTADDEPAPTPPPTASASQTSSSRKDPAPGWGSGGPQFHQVNKPADLPSSFFKVHGLAPPRVQGSHTLADARARKVRRMNITPCWLSTSIAGQANSSQGHQLPIQYNSIRKPHLPRFNLSRAATSS